MLSEKQKTDMLVALLWMMRGLFVLSFLWGFAALLMMGCSLMLDETHAPTVRTMIVSTSPQETYARATRTAAQMQAPILHADAEHYRLTVQASQVVALSIVVEPVPAGTRLTVSGQIRPRAMLIGFISEPDDFIAAYRTQG